MIKWRSLVEIKRIHFIVSDLIVAEELLVDVDAESFVVALDGIIAKDGVSTSEIG